jgi:hypothetical protein
MSKQCSNLSDCYEIMPVENQFDVPIFANI